LLLATTGSKFSLDGKGIGNSRKNPWDGYGDLIKPARRYYQNLCATRDTKRIHNLAVDEIPYLFTERNNMRRLTLYTDGGTIVYNPSYYGGTYAFVLVDQNKTPYREIYRQSGIYTPKYMGAPKVTDNQMELLAILLGLQYAETHRLPVLTVVSDSKITLGRVFQNWSLKNIPSWMVELKDSLSVSGLHGVFQKGHSGNKWNELCDELCRTEEREFLRKIGQLHVLDHSVNYRYQPLRK
jgi:ribonuclease HI